MSEENTYVLPDSELELARIQLQGTLLDEVLPLMPQLFQAEQRLHARVLDLACGPGSWVLDVGRAYPAFEVIGIDVNPRMISYARAQAEVLQSDVEFAVMDILQPLDFADGSFDLVNLRLGAGFLPRARAAAVLQECWRVLKPGGVFRNTEPAHISAPSRPYQQMLAWISDALFRAGMTSTPYTMAVSAETAHLLREIGFQPIDLTPHVVDMSAGSTLHHTMYDDTRVTIALLKPLLVERLHICDASEFERVASEMDQAWNDAGFSAHWYLSSVCGMKPGTKS